MSHVLTKSTGGLVAVSWRVENRGGQPGQAELQITEFAPEIGQDVVLASLGPVGILPGSAITMVKEWAIPAATGMTYSLQARVVDAGTRRNVATHPFTVNVPASAPAARPTDAEIIAAAQALASGVPFPSTGFFIGLALLDFGLISLNPEAISDLMSATPGSETWTWQQALDWWKTSGLMR